MGDGEKLGLAVSARDERRVLGWVDHVAGAEIAGLDPLVLIEKGSFGGVGAAFGHS